MNPPLFQRWLSYLWPIAIEKKSSEWNPALEVTLYRGHYVLDSENANYSFGLLHKVMQDALLHASVKYQCRFEKVLLLGYGGGSAAQIIHTRWNPQAEITAVEIDPVVIALAQKYFYSERVHFVCANAAQAIGEDTQTYDLILCDLFRDTEMPAFCTSAVFYQNLKSRLSVGGLFIQNIMSREQEFLRYKAVFESNWREIDILQRVRYNYLLFGRPKV
ncbi:MAG: fused MFS/spermidine synthase [Bacteroidia bacterium]|nr:fused MFS/spermidine synthase [Bacteroidia bacterium]